jgi:hypothetical protein
MGSLDVKPVSFGQLAFGQRTAYTSQLPHACCQKRWTKSADLQRPYDLSGLKFVLYPDMGIANLGPLITNPLGFNIVKS